MSITGKVFGESVGRSFLSFQTSMKVILSFTASVGLTKGWKDLWRWKGLQNGDKHQLMKWYELHFKYWFFAYSGFGMKPIYTFAKSNLRLTDISSANNNGDKISWSFSKLQIQYLKQVLVNPILTFTVKLKVTLVDTNIKYKQNILMLWAPTAMVSWSKISTPISKVTLLEKNMILGETKH